jgi:hypothetical protein
LPGWSFSHKAGAVFLADFSLRPVLFLFKRLSVVVGVETFDLVSPPPDGESTRRHFALFV